MNTIGGIGVAVAAFLLVGAEVAPAQSRPAGQPVTVRFWGHACFTIAAEGKTLLIDPYNAQVGYKTPDVTADLVLITHEHFDHSDVSWVKGKPLVLHGLDKGGQVQAIERTVGPFRIRAVAGKHWEDPAQKQRGSIAMFVIEVNGLKFVHVGDLGETLSQEQVKAIGRPDVLMVPVGGFFTIDAEGAHKVVQQLKPRAYVIPMHYRTPALSVSLQSKLAEPGPFLRQFGERVVRLDSNEFKIDPASLPAETEAVLMDYAR